MAIKLILKFLSSHQTMGPTYTCKIPMLMRRQSQEEPPVLIYVPSSWLTTIVLPSKQKVADTYMHAGNSCSFSFLITCLCLWSRNENWRLHLECQILEIPFTKNILYWHPGIEGELGNIFGQSCTNAIITFKSPPFAKTQTALAVLSSVSEMGGKNIQFYQRAFYHK